MQVVEYIETLILIINGSSHQNGVNGETKFLIFHLTLGILRIAMIAQEMLVPTER